MPVSKGKVGRGLGGLPARGERQWLGGFFRGTGRNWGSFPSDPRFGGHLEEMLRDRTPRVPPVFYHPCCPWRVAESRCRGALVPRHQGQGDLGRFVRNTWSGGELRQFFLSERRKGRAIFRFVFRPGQWALYFPFPLIVWKRFGVKLEEGWEKVCLRYSHLIQTR